MANPEHVEILLQGSKIWNKWRGEKHLTVPQLDEAVLSGLDLSQVDISQANLSFADLRDTNLNEANLVSSDLTYANFSGANLSYADLGYANLYYSLLTHANLHQSDLQDAIFNGTDLSYANLTEAIIGQTTLCNLDLSTTKGLNSVIHLGPSSLGIDTFLKSKGQIPDVFLLGCGIPQNEISHLRAMSSKEYNSCFISYSHKDEEFAHHLHKALLDKNIRVWYAPEDMKRGQKIHEQVNKAIHSLDRLLLVLSDESMTSEWVKTEIHTARQRELKHDERILFPISLVPFTRIKEWKFPDGDTGKDLAREIREFYIPDFSNWKDDASFEREFSRLVRDLKASSSESETV